MYVMFLARFHVTATSKYIIVIYLGLSLVSVLKNLILNPKLITNIES